VARIEGATAGAEGPQGRKRTASPSLARARDEAAGGSHGDLSRRLEEVVERCSAAVRSVAWRHGLTEADVDEVFQDVRIRLWKALDSGEKIGSIPASYVYRAATSAALDLIRRRRARREETLEPLTGTGLEARSSDAGPEARLSGGETVALVQQAVEGLMESRRPVVRMHLAGYRMEEIAALLGWTSGKTRNLLYRGLADLRQALVALGLEPGAGA